MSINTRVQDLVLFFPKAINFSRVTTWTSRGAAVEWESGNALRLETGTVVGSAAAVDGYLPIYLNQEPYVTVTLNASFDAPAPGVRQLIGLGDASCGVFVGYDGLNFGILHRKGGSLRHWALKITSVCVEDGSVVISIAGGTATIPVRAGDGPMGIMRAASEHPALRDLNLRTYMCCDRVTVYAEEAATYAGLPPDSIDFGATGVEGSLTTIVPGAVATETWVLREDFNAVNRVSIADLPLDVMNVYAFRFSRWSSGAITFLMLNTHNDDMSELHKFTPGPEGFNTSIPYIPHVSVRAGEGSEASLPRAMRSSMAVVSSGTPSTATNNTWFSTTFAAADVMATADGKTVIGMMTVPRASTTGRNHMLANVAAIKINASTPRDIRVIVIVNGVVDQLIHSELHLPWSCMRRAVPAVETTVSGGGQVANIYIRENSGERTFSPAQLWLAPGTNLIVSVSAVGEPVTCGLDVEVSWTEN